MRFSRDNLRMVATGGSGFRRARLWPLALIAIAIAAFWSLGWHRYLTITNLYEQRNALKGLIADRSVIAVGLYLLLYTAVTALSLPGAAALTIAGGFLLGWAVGGAATVVAATAGATILFLVVRTSLGENLAARAGPFVAKLADGFRTDAFNYLLFLRLVPAFPFFIVNLVPALCGVPLRTYVLATLIGIIPGTFAFAFAGAGLDSVFAAAGTAYDACKAAGGVDCQLSVDAKSLVTRELVIAIAALGVVALIPIALKRWRAARS